MSDQAELIAGTDPSDPSSFLKLESHLASGGAMVLSWLSVTGRTYTVQFKAGAFYGGWQTLTNGIQGTGQIFLGAPVQVQDPVNTASDRFYRLGVFSN